MRSHPLVGERICGSLRFAREVGPVIRHHHERWDGGGYVDGIAGEQIPYLARVIAVVDAYDAMSSDRPYRAALPPEERVRRLSEGAGTQWDPDVVQTFLRLIRNPGRLDVPRPATTVS
jgi:putative two-component system response regulator